MIGAAHSTSDAGTAGTENSAIGKLLFQAATPELFRTNAFRVTGLNVDAGAREINRQAGKLKTMEELGQGRSFHLGALALNPPPSVDQIREAIQHLKEPERRIVDELFWLWPRKFGESSKDPAILAIEKGDADTAMDIWGTLEGDPIEGIFAKHNAAVLWHLMAVEWEKHYECAGQLHGENRAKTEKMWRDALTRWEQVGHEDRFWERLAERILQFDDARLTNGCARRMRNLLPVVLCKINGDLALRYAESKQLDLAKMHVRLMSAAGQDRGVVTKTAELILEPAVSRVKQQIRTAKHGSASDARAALKSARELLDQTRQALPLFMLLFCEERNSVRDEVWDEVAEVCNKLQVEYHKSTGDHQGCLDLLEDALPFATSNKVQEQIEKNITVLTGNLRSKQLEPVFALLKKLHESSEHPSARLNRFRRGAVPAISRMFPDGIDDSAEHAGLSDTAANVLRSISIAAWNTHKDKRTAVAANTLAAKYARTADLRQRLAADRTALLAPQINAGTSDPCLLLTCVSGIILLLIGIFSITSEFRHYPVHLKELSLSAFLILYGVLLSGGGIFITVSEKGRARAKTIAETTYTVSKNVETPFWILCCLYGTFAGCFPAPPGILWGSIGCILGLMAGATGGGCCLLLLRNITISTARRIYFSIFGTILTLGITSLCAAKFWVDNQYNITVTGSYDTFHTFLAFLIVIFGLGVALGLLLRQSVQRARDLGIMPLLGEIPTMEHLKHLAQAGLGEKIFAIKLYRQIHKVGFMEAMDAVKKMRFKSNLHGNHKSRP